MVEFCFLTFFFISCPNNDTMSLNQKTRITAVYRY